MANPTRILTHRPQRKLTDEQVHSLLSAYVDTDTTYKALSEQYSVSQRTVSGIVSGLIYRDLLGVSGLRKKAQEKAATRSGKYSKAEALRVSDPTQSVIGYYCNSVASVDAAILHLQAVRLLLSSASEVSL
jgi:hypothetical protein